MLLRDRFWLWGHPEGVYNNAWGNDKPSRMTPMEACLYLGIKKTFMVPVGVNVNRRQYNKSFKTLKEVAWECFKAGQNPELIEPLIREAGDFDNITGVVFDDFQRQRKGDDQDRLLKNLWSIHDRLHNNEVRPLNMWMVLYTCEFGMNAEEDEEFLRLAEPFDGIIMWT